ncbi:MAG: MaoC family dehydratase N-terminal domain-containing protein [Minwuia sp.]|uniref:FAS1-like dehydratase domain-containing protein n=1 Tax=Minwuia sp. TaxID=2493630 RepID=UPI003A850D37
MNAHSEIEASTTRDLSAWIGATETREGRLNEELAGMLAAATGHARSRTADCGSGEAMPALWHWAAFPEFSAMSELGDDGHPRRGGFLPPVPLPRRMWAGGELRFDGALKIGEPLQRSSRIEAVDANEGGAGPMYFVRVRHRIEGADGQIDERQDIVYLNIPDRFRAPKALVPPAAPAFEEHVEASPQRLFRFSAATFNTHRIHYDRTYAIEVEKYPALVVHGPLQAILLMEAATRHAGAAPRSFRFKGVHPMFDTEPLRLLGVRDGDAYDLCTATSDHQGLVARMEWVQ